MKLELQKFIDGNEDWEDLLEADPYRLTIKHAEGYVIFKYNLIDSPDFSIPLMNECRGIILRESDLQVVCRPFDKFFNIQEECAADIDWKTVSVTEKIDGSLIKVWHDGLLWRVSTNGTINASDAEIVSMNNIGSRTFYDLFTYAAHSQELDWKLLNKHNTYLFELCSPYNKVVIHYGETQIFHLATRNTLTGEYLNDDIGIKKPEKFSLSTPDECLDLANDFPFDEEGYVIQDANFNMVKIKSPAYVAAHRLVNNGVITPRRILDIIEANGHDDFLALFPEYTDSFDEVISSLHDAEKNADEIVELLRKFDFAERKDLAEFALSTEFPGFVFSYNDGHVDDFKDWFFGLARNSKLKILGY